MLAVILAMTAAASLPRFLKEPITPDQYPPSALRRNAQDFNQVRLIVNPVGAVERCDIVVESEYSDLDAPVCRLMKRARLKPAQDRDGLAAYGVIKKWTSWSIGSPASPPVTADVVLSLNRLPAGLSGKPLAKLVLVVAADGEVSSCDVAESSGSPALDKAACTSGVAAAQIAAVQAAAGMPARSVQSLDVAFSVGQAGGQ